MRRAPAGSRAAVVCDSAFECTHEALSSASLANSVTGVGKSLLLLETSPASVRLGAEWAGGAAREWLHARVVKRCVTAGLESVATLGLSEARLTRTSAARAAGDPSGPIVSSITGKPPRGRLLARGILMIILFG